MNTTEAAKLLLEKGFVITYYSNDKVCGKAKNLSFEQIRIGYEDGIWFGSGYKAEGEPLYRRDKACSIEEMLLFFMSFS